MCWGSRREASKTLWSISFATWVQKMGIEKGDRYLFFREDCWFAYRAEPCHGSHKDMSLGMPAIILNRRNGGGTVAKKDGGYQTFLA